MRVSRRSPVSRHWLRTAAALAILCGAALTSAAAADVDLAAGTLLVADRKLSDPHFQKTLILVLNYGERGTLGLIVNRPTDVPVSQLLPTKETRDRTDTAFNGGPV